MELSFDINSVSTRFVVLHPLYSYATVSICESPLILILPPPSQALALRLLTCHEQNNKNNVREEHHNHVGGWLNSLMAISDSLPLETLSSERPLAQVTAASPSLSGLTMNTVHEGYAYIHHITSYSPHSIQQS